ncbi:MAG: hypothetical protein JSV22_02400 [Bacteroidales bacterium]|nr:MAG: hypothetical protein JSV22_02400 [Bacteroidales bacterium]
MKRSILIFLVIGVTMLFFGCSEDSPMTPELDQDDPTTNDLKCARGEKTEFSGISNFVAPGDAGTSVELPNGKILVKGISSQWHDDADDYRVTGNSFWYFNQLISGENTAQLWGRAELYVDNDGGKWNMRWHGYQAPTPDGGFIIVADVFGRGVEGEVKGLVAKWRYTMNISEGFFYAIEGYIR